LRFSQRCYEKLIFSVRSRCVTGSVVPHFSKMCSALIMHDFNHLPLKFLDCLTLMMKTLRAFEISGTTYPTIQRHISEKRVFRTQDVREPTDELQQHKVETNFLFDYSVTKNTHMFAFCQRKSKENYNIKNTNKCFEALPYFRYLEKTLKFQHFTT
jgi:hypothetical protein